ncbi:MAG: UPF0147 family protein [Nanoarchaeota archaeon]
MTTIMKNTADFSMIITALHELQNDSGVTKNIKIKISEMLSALRAGADNSLIANKMLAELEEISNDINLQPFVRTQLYNISSMLETL